MRFGLLFLFAVLVTKPCLAWWEAGHQIISLLAYDLLTEDEQQRVQQLLQAHPRLIEDFASPVPQASQVDLERWRIGRAGYWPDVARSNPDYNRPNWHYQLGATLVIGKPDNVPKTPGPAPDSAALQTPELHIAQAVEVCRRVLRDPQSSASDKSLTICWLAHLVGDAHQPCHAGSLYVAGVFPEGDRGANLIHTRQAKNLHALWDSLLGDRYDAGDIRRRCEVIRSNTDHWKKAALDAGKSDGLDPLIWLAESSEFGRSHVYTPEVLGPVDAVARQLTPKLEVIELSEDYLKAAGELARLRAAHAAHRLALILSQDLR
jgi:hypothetical protein